MNGPHPFATLHPRLLFHDRLATAIEHSMRTGGRPLAVLCLEGTDTGRLADLGPWRAQEPPAALDSNGLSFILLEPIGREAPAPEPGIGVAVFPRDAGDPESLLRVAAAAARGGAAPPAPEETRHAKGRPDGSLELYYQPVIELRSGRAIAVEALARRPAGRGPAAEQDLAGAPSEMPDGDGFWALEQAVCDLRSWRELGCADMQVAINMSLDQACSAELPAKIEALLGAGSLPPGCLEIELTEHRPCLDHGAVAAALEPLRALGVRLALDDFGTGFASLSLFRHLALDTLKVDRSFVAALCRPGDGQDAEGLVRDIIGLARDRGLRVVAEGVEDAAQLAALQRLGCDACQGYLFSAPLPGPALGALFAAGRPPPWGACGETA